MVVLRLMSSRSQAWRAEAEAWAGTATRWVGLIMVVYGFAIDRGKNPVIITTGGTLALLKTLGLGKNGDEKKK